MLGTSVLCSFEISTYVQTEVWIGKDGDHVSSCSRIARWTGTQLRGQTSRLLLFMLAIPGHLCNPRDWLLPSQERTMVYLRSDSPAMTNKLIHIGSANTGLAVRPVRGGRIRGVNCCESAGPLRCDVGDGNCWDRGGVIRGSHRRASKGKLLVATTVDAVQAKSTLQSAKGCVTTST